MNLMKIVLACAIIAPLGIGASAPVSAGLFDAAGTGAKGAVSPAGRGTVKARHVIGGKAMVRVRVSRGVLATGGRGGAGAAKAMRHGPFKTLSAQVKSAKPAHHQAARHLGFAEASRTVSARLR